MILGPTDERRKILVFVACFNQEQEITHFLSKLKQVWSVQDCIVVDDGSSDASVRLAQAQGYRVILHSRNRGVGAAIRTGILYGKDHGYTHIVMMSANGKMNPNEIGLVIRPVTQGQADYVTGSRFLAGGAFHGLSTFRRVGIKGFSWFWYHLTGYRFSDITCGFRCYSIAFASGLDLGQEWLDRYEMEYYIHYWACKKGLKIQEVPVAIRYDHLQKGRESKIRPFSGWWSMIRPVLFLVLGLRK